MDTARTALTNEDFIRTARGSGIRLETRTARTDLHLADLAAAGDEDAFEEIFHRHKRLVAIVAARYYRRPEDIEEMVQIAFAKAFVELGSFRGAHDRSLMSWLARITANSCLDALRSRNRRPERLDCDLTEPEKDQLAAFSSVDASTHEKELLDSDLIEKVLARLPDNERWLLQMMYAYEMSVAEIAEVLGCSTANVKVRLWRARAAMRKVLRKIM